MHMPKDYPKEKPKGMMMDYINILPKAMHKDLFRYLCKYIPNNKTKT